MLIFKILLPKGLRHGIGFFEKFEFACNAFVIVTGSRLIFK